MGFKRITFIKPEPVPVVDPAQLDLEQVIAQVKAQDINVPQSDWKSVNIESYSQYDIVHIGWIAAVDGYNPFSNNTFVFYKLDEQPSYKAAIRISKVYYLDEHMCPILDSNGNAQLEAIDNHRLSFLPMVAVGIK